MDIEEGVAGFPVELEYAGGGMVVAESGEGVTWRWCAEEEAGASGDVGTALTCGHGDEFEARTSGWWVEACSWTTAMGDTCSSRDDADAESEEESGNTKHSDFGDVVMFRCREGLVLGEVYSCCDAFGHGH